MNTEYIKTSWQDGDIITADKMNNIENGIKDVGDTIGELKENLDDLKSAFNLTAFEFVHGNVYNGSIDTDQSRIHSVEMIWLPAGSRIVSSASFGNMSVGRYNLDGTYATNGTWGTTYTAPVDCYVQIVLRKSTDDANIDTAEFADLVSTLLLFYANDAATTLYNGMSNNTEKTVLAENLRTEYGILNLHDSDNVAIANLFNKEDPDVTTNGYYDRTNSFVSSATLGSTGYIRVFQGYEYYTNLEAGFFVLWFTDDKTFIKFSDVSGANVKFTVPVNAVYMRCLFRTANIDSYAVKCDMIFTIKSAVSPFAENLRSEYGILNLHDSDNVAIANLFNKEDPDVTTNGYYDRTNSFVSSATLGSTGYIRVFQGYEYYTNLEAGFFVLWFTDDKTFIKFSDVSGANVKFTVPVNAVYMRCLFKTANINSYAVKCDMISAIKSAVGPFAGKSGVAFGTSLTYRAATTGGYLQFLPALLDATVENKGLGNSTILDNGSNPKMMDVITGYNGYASKDFAILEGFVNDWYNNAASLGTWKDTDTTTVCGCVRTAIQYILTQNPSITLILVIDPIGRSASGVDCSSLATRNGLTQTEFYDEIAKVADTLGIPTVRVDRNSGMSELTPYMYIDNIHPNAEGAEQTANTIWNVMKNIPIKVIDS